jgi:hypothetical protein
MKNTCPRPGETVVKPLPSPLGEKSSVEGALAGSEFPMNTPSSAWFGPLYPLKLIQLLELGLAMTAIALGYPPSGGIAFWLESAPDAIVPVALN